MFKYQVIKNAVSFELANFIFNYFLLKRDAVKFLYDNNLVYDTGMFGTWSDKQVPNTYSHYADMVMETLMICTVDYKRQERIRSQPLQNPIWFPMFSLGRRFR